MSHPVIEANLIKTFRLFLVIELILFIVGFPTHSDLAPIEDIPWNILGVGVSSILLFLVILYLVSVWQPRRYCSTINLDGQ